MLNLMMEKEEIELLMIQFGVQTSTSMLAEITESFIDKLLMKTLLNTEFIMLF